MHRDDEIQRHDKLERFERNARATLGASARAHRRDARRANDAAAAWLFVRSMLLLCDERRCCNKLKELASKRATIRLRSRASLRSKVLRALVRRFLARARSLARLLMPQPPPTAQSDTHDNLDDDGDRQR